MVLVRWAFRIISNELPLANFKKRAHGTGKLKNDKIITYLSNFNSNKQDVTYLNNRDKFLIVRTGNAINPENKDKTAFIKK